MKQYNDYLVSIDNPVHRVRMEEVLMWVSKKFPKLNFEIKWNQPMFTDHGTFIVAFSMAKLHLAVAPEKVVINRFLDDISQVGYSHTKELIRIKWDDPIDYAFLEKIINFNIIDKLDCQSFWRK